MTSAESAPSTPAEDVVLHTLTPYLAVGDARRALDFYADAFGARRRGDPVVMDDGRIGHAELAVGDSVLMLADEFGEIGMLAPSSRGGPSQTLLLQVTDVDAAVARAVQAGAELTRPVADSPHGRNGVVVDPFGHRWMISAVPAPPT
ncbi:MAG TPA: VOC family protein [Pseudonocardiaceae bacterium]|nr:VOC family protein [Pseudonocardiaceae bacterium]